MFIGKLAESIGVNVQTIRYYEQIGLLKKPARTATGYRMYGEPALKRLRFIKQAQALGFSLDEIKEILTISSEGKPPCARVRKLAKAKLSELDQRLSELLAYRQELASRINQWEQLPDAPFDAAVCHLIELSKAEKTS